MCVTKWVRLTVVAKFPSWFVLKVNSSTLIRYIINKHFVASSDLELFISFALKWPLRRKSCIFSMCCRYVRKPFEISKYRQWTAVSKVNMGFPMTLKSAKICHPKLDPLPLIWGSKALKEFAKNLIFQFYMIKLYCEVSRNNNFPRQRKFAHVFRRNNYRFEILNRCIFTQLERFQGIRIKRNKTRQACPTAIAVPLV